MITVTVYVREQCPECDQVLEELKSLQETSPHQVAVVNVDQDAGLREKIGEPLPMLVIGPYRLHPPFTRQDLQIRINAARDRADQLERVDQAAFQDRYRKGHTLTSGDKLSLWISKHYLGVATLLLFLYVGLPFLAPVLMKAGNELPARVIYRVYSPMCHQLAFRSFFIFGQQAYYPRELAGMEGVTSYETLIDSEEIDLNAARGFVGNEVVGYKVALCQRDVAIYGTMLLFVLIFALTGRRITSIPWYFWIVIGLGPIGLDGFSQLPSFAQGLPDWFPMRESTPALRALTGAMFGWMTAWYLFPMIEQSAREARLIVQRKKAVIEQARLNPEP